MGDLDHKVGVSAFVSNCWGVSWAEGALRLGSGRGGLGGYAVFSFLAIHELSHPVIHALEQAVSVHLDNLILDEPKGFRGRKLNEPEPCFRQDLEAVSPFPETLESGSCLRRSRIRKLFPCFGPRSVPPAELSSSTARQVPRQLF